MTAKPTNPANIITDAVIFVFLSFPATRYWVNYRVKSITIYAIDYSLKLSQPRLELQ